MPVPMSFVEEKFTLNEGMNERAHAVVVVRALVENRLDGCAITKRHWRSGRVDDELMHQVASDRPLVFQQQLF